MTAEMIRTKKVEGVFIEAMKRLADLAPVMDQKYLKSRVMELFDMADKLGLDNDEFTVQFNKYSSLALHNSGADA